MHEEVVPGPLHSPIAVFDAGIGSYGIVQLIHRHYPDQDLLYFADRASFPYGGKTKEALAQSIRDAIARLAEMGAHAVVLASNAPSVMVLDELGPQQPVPVLGIYPPVADALARSQSGQIAVLGVESLIQSAEIRAYVARQAGGLDVGLVNASPLVQLVEEGTFLSNPGATLEAVQHFIQELRQDRPGLDVCTLSSTHLPWLAPFFALAAPDVDFLDPAESLIPRLRPYVASGTGQIRCIATESPSMPVSGLQRMLTLLGVDLKPKLVI
ncbi:glutamate racemase [Roseateles flavus]|uniref:Aspartate/glutamate racemase family protein n=1 Tax=Roseateles flavus TaxID=3149041 RepID=A0ABV0GG87_9BURK